MKAITIALVFFIFLSSNQVFASSEESRLEHALKIQEQLSNDSLNIADLLDQPWYIRHKWKLIGGAVAVGVAAISVATFGTATAPAAAGGASLVAAGATTSGWVAASGVAAEMIISSIIIEKYVNSSGDFKTLPEKKEATLNYYNNHYKLWAAQTSSNEEFGKIALKELIKFNEQNN